MKDPEADHLAGIAGATGQTTTGLVTGALREGYEQIQQRKGRASVDELLAIAGRAAARLRRPYADHAELLHGPDGLPK